MAPGLAFIPNFEFAASGNHKWANDSGIDGPLLNSLAASSAKHLRLDGAFESQSIDVVQETWPLKSLDIINICWDFCFNIKSAYVEPSLLWGSIFRACSSTRQRLKIRYYPYDFLDEDKGIEVDAELPVLESLQIESESHISSSSLRSLLQRRKLSTIILSMSESAQVECLEDLGYKEALRTLVLTAAPYPVVVVPLQPLQDNPQLTGFGALYAIPPMDFDPLFLCSRKAPQSQSPLATMERKHNPPVLAHRSIFPCNPGATAPHGGIQVSWNHDWFVDHDKICRTLRPLCPASSRNSS
ncbi:hypothetical protein BJX64DRAFT_267055 [Aspergillus heterothallicus]